VAAGTQPPLQFAAGHPRLWVRQEDLPRLRAWATDSNPLYKDGLLPLVEQAKQDMDSGAVEKGDDGGRKYTDTPHEMYAELFAFMSLISSDQATRDDYAQRARTLIMRVFNEAAKGPAAGQPYRDPEFFTSDSDRPRWWGQGFPLTVDWIYPYLSAADKATIRKVFLRWSQEIVTGAYKRPDPVGVLNDPVLTSDPSKERWAANNYFTGHMRNLGLMAMSLDPTDDPGGQLGGYLREATGAWLYMADYNLRHDSQGGLSPEGFEYSPSSVGYVIQLLLALHTAGQDDPGNFGPQVVLTANPYWNDMLTAYFHSMSPVTVASKDNGQVYQAAWYGDGLNYWAPDMIESFGPLGIYDDITGNSAQWDALRWVETNMSPGGASALTARVSGAPYFGEAVLYYLLLDPTAKPPADPRPLQPLSYFAPGTGHLFARTDWGPNATWFDYSLSWNTIDHQHADGNNFEFYRQGEWLTKERTGYDLGTSDYHNTLALENDPLQGGDSTDYLHDISRRGSQWAYVPAGDPKILAHSFGQGFAYALGDATNLYNSLNEGPNDITQASRSITWLQPDYIVVYDRAASKTAGRYKRFWLQLPAQASVAGNRAIMQTAKGQQLFVTTLLPAGAAITSEADEPMTDLVAQQEPMKYRLKVEAPGGPQDTRFLNVLQGADPGAAPAQVSSIQSSGAGGTPFVGAVVGGTAVLFPVDLNPGFSSLQINIPAGTSTLMVTGLGPGASYDVGVQGSGANSQVQVTLGTQQKADDGGVLVVKLPR
jgi:hypothetical protein